jgi:inorganic pyrophosphatase
MDLKKIPFGSMEAFNVLVENSRGSQNKYEYDEELETIKLDFVFSGDLKWPYNYGFIPHTRAGDGDMLDVCVLSSHAIDPGVVVKCKAIGMIEVLDRGEVDNKILAVALPDLLAEKYSDITDLSDEQIREFEDFLQDLAVQKNKIMEIKGFRNKEIAEAEIKKSAAK